MGKANSEIQINPYTFSKMTELRFLKFYGSENKCMVSSLEGVPFTEVRYFEWHQYPLKTLDIHAENLVSLKMPGSKVKQLWDDVQNLVNLKKIDLWYSKLLTKLPDLSLAQNLEILDLGGCSSLTETHSSIQYLNKLEVLDLDRCESLRTLPTSIQSKYLKRLVLRGCSNLKNFPEISSSGIHRLDLTHVGIKELPSSIDRLSKLDTLKIHDCTKLPCNLHDLDASGCTSLEALPASLSSKFYLSVDLSNCLKLDLSELSEIIKDRWMKQSYNYASCRGIYFPGDEILKLFRYQSMGSSVTLETPPPAPAGYNKLMGFAFCAVIAFSVPDHHHYWKGYLYCDLKVKSEGSYGHLHSRYLGEFSYLESDHVFLKIISYVEADSVFLRSYLSDSEDLVESFEEVYEVYFGIRCPHSQCLDCEVKKCGIDFVYAQDSRRPKRLKY
ncbi:hypothetical protein CUMW_176140 [Citrus unshiu]|nr:hypothetical protein CUMW_176140 [Citrus unshiu]